MSVQPRIVFRIDVRASIGLLRFLVSVFHLFIWGMSLHRPHMVDIVPGYSGFQAIMPTTSWGWTAFVVGFGLLFMPRGSMVLIIWQFFSMSLLAVFSLMSSVVYGPIWGTVAYAFPACISGLVMWFTAQDWADRQAWYHRARTRMQERRHGR